MHRLTRHRLTGRAAALGSIAVVIAAAVGVPAQAAPVPSGRAAKPMALGLYTQGNESGDFSADQAWPVAPSQWLEYNCWDACGFPTSYAQTAYADGYEPYVEMESWNDPYSSASQGDVPITQITAGDFDSYLTTFAQQINSYGHQVELTFDHEANGDWYPWGWHGSDGITPAQWKAAWKHVVTKIDAVTKLVTWVWAPNANIPGATTTLKSYWPGGAYVGVVGLDGYQNSAGSTFAKVFNPSLNQVHSLTSDPWIVTETGINDSLDQASLIGPWIKAAHRAGASGFDYFEDSNYVLTSAAQTAFAQAWPKG
jgi:hypothetical protein